MNDLLLNLRHLGNSPSTDPVSPLPDQALVFVHGIFSSHVTFEPLVEGLLRIDPSLAKYGRYYFDYDFNRPIAYNGQRLGHVLTEAFPEKKPEITLVGHSMGGLVARAALLQAGNLGMVKRLVMLGTPNHGTLQTARLGALAHLTREATGVLWTTFARHATGIKELTETGKTMQPLIDAGKRRTWKVEYVSIPGLRFHSEAGWLESPPNTSAGLRVVGVILAFMRAFPGLHTELKVPHDGIVESRSVRLSSEQDDFSERPHGNPQFPYLHLTHPDYKTVDHVTVQQAERTISLLADLLQTPDLKTWLETLKSTGDFNLYPS